MPPKKGAAKNEAAKPKGKAAKPVNSLPVKFRGLQVRHDFCQRYYDGVVQSDGTILFKCEELKNVTCNVVQPGEHVFLCESGGATSKSGIKVTKIIGLMEYVGYEEVPHEDIPARYSNHLVQEHEYAALKKSWTARADKGGCFSWRFQNYQFSVPESGCYLPTGPQDICNCFVFLVIPPTGQSIYAYVWIYLTQGRWLDSILQS